MNLLLLSGEIYKTMSVAEENHLSHAIPAEALLKELNKFPSEVFNSYEAFLAEIMRYLKILPQK